MNSTLRLFSALLLLVLFVYIGSIGSQNYTNISSPSDSYSLSQPALQSCGPVEEDMMKFLRSRPELEGANITANLTSKNTMALQGTVINFYQKKRALTLAKQQNEVDGHFWLSDELRVIAPAMQFSIHDDILVADSDGKLHSKLYQSPERLISPYKINELQRHHLQAVIDASKVLFPEGTEVLSVDTNAGSPNHQIIAVNLNQAFLNKSFWRHKDSMRLAIYSIVNNIGNIDLPKGPPLPVQILIEGKHVKNFQGFNISKPRKPDMSLVMEE